MIWELVLVALGFIIFCYLIHQIRKYCEFKEWGKKSKD